MWIILSHIAIDVNLSKKRSPMFSNGLLAVEEDRVDREFAIKKRIQQNN